MKKYNKILIITLLFISIMINFVLFNRTINVKQEPKIIKQMNESTQVMDLNNQITELIKSHEEYAKYVEEKLAELKKSTKIYFLGTGTSFDIAAITGLDSSVLENLTEDNFIVGVQSASAASCSTVFGQAGGLVWKSSAAGFNLQKNFDSSANTLTISGYSQNIALNVTNGTGSWGNTQQTTCFAYLVLGDIIS